MNALFEIGQKVVCVDGRGHNVKLVEGKTYTINGIKNSPCGCSAVVVDVGIRTQVRFTRCFSCGGFYPADGWRRQERFVPLDFDKAADKEIREALKENILI